MKVYLAGPLGFSEAGRGFHWDRVVRCVMDLGHTPLDPWSDDPPPGIVATLATEIRQVAAGVKAAREMDYGPAKRDAWRELNPRMAPRTRG